MNAASPGSTRAVPAARSANTERVHDALGLLFRARGLIAGASLLAGVAHVSVRDDQAKRTGSAMRLQYAKE